MQFSEWVEKSGKSRGEIADQLGCSRAFVSQLILGQKTPGLILAIHIERLTEGEIKPRDWFSMNGHRP